MASLLSRTGNGTKPVKAVSEATRERETFKYDPYLFSDSRFNSDGRLFPSSQIATASDSVLTGLAQLGTYQTGTAHAFISLFDATHQYIVAEAVPSMPITPGLPSDELPVPIALCGTAIPRDQGTCDHVLYLPASRDATDPAELPLSFVPNLATDSRFTSRPYCQFGEAGQFYAAVPIRTRKGINIGAFCVMNETVPDGWNDLSPRCLRDISHAVMEHLEVNRSRHAHRRNERMNTGLSSFIEGKATLTGWQSGSNPDAYIDSITREGALNARQQWLEHQEREDNKEDEPAHLVSKSRAGLDGMTVPWGGSLAGRPKGTPGMDGAPRASRASVHGAADPLTSGESATLATSNTDEKTPSWVFSKAANVIREAFEVEGCIFFDVKLGSYRKPSMHAAPGELDVADVGGHVPSASSSDEQPQASLADETDSSCALLGFSTTRRASINGAEPIDGDAGILPKRFLAKLLRRYPSGKIFNFDAIGELQSSDSSEEDGGAVIQPVRNNSPLTRDGGGEDTPAPIPRERRDKRHSQAQEGALIRRAFPSARSVAFIPIWDSRKERWLAGGFVYTLIPTRVFSAGGELSFFKAFASLIATEVASLETLQANKAKSDALGSLSHELRSPLHGIILATELLNDTELDVFQGNAAHTVEICCRTLLDTIDHLLDYSKVNNLTEKRKLGSSGDPPNLGKRVKADLFGKKQLWLNARLDGLVEEVVESVFAGFNFQHMSIRQLSKQDTKKHIDTAAHRRSDFAQAMEQLSPGHGHGGYRMQLDNVSVYLSIDPTCDWMFHLQPGAIRRIVMNLFGNALKYTSKGSVQISLTQATPAFRRSTTERVVKLTVKDTGKGMTEDFLRYKIFKPFSQEDELATGTGLGLSLVKVIVSQLQGQISVKSQVQVGTTITVTLQLDQPSQASSLPLELPEEDQVFEEQVRELTGLRVQLSGFDSSERGNERAAVEDICRRWLHLDIASDPEIIPDIVLRSEDAPPESLGDVARLAKTPTVVVCQNALAAYQQFTRFDTVGQSGIFDFISQPVGPRKLARSMLLTYKRWSGLSRDVARPPAPSREASFYAKQAPQEEKDDGRKSSPTRGVEQAETPASISLTKPSDADALQVLSSEEMLSTSEASGVTARKVLVVDDNYINLKVLSAYMGKLRCAYEAVTNGKEAVEAYMRQPSDFAGILMDISMPVMDGLEATRRIRLHERRNQLSPVAILALTGLASDKTQQEALESGVDVFLTKPVRLKTLSEVLKSLDITLALPEVVDSKRA